MKRLRLAVLVFTLLGAGTAFATRPKPQPRRLYRLRSRTPRKLYTRRPSRSPRLRRR